MKVDFGLSDAWNDLGGVIVLSGVVGTAAAILTTPIIGCLVPSDREHLTAMCAIAAACTGLFLEVLVLLRGATKRRDPERRVFPLRCLCAFLGAVVGGQIAVVLSISGTITPTQLEVFGIVAAISFIAALLIVAEIRKLRRRPGPITP